MQLKLALQQGTEALQKARVSDPKLDAELLLQHVLKRDKAYLLAHPELVLACGDLTRYHDALRQRGSGKPIQYITGHQEFWGLDFVVTPAVLIPRPETEHLVEAVLELLNSEEAATHNRGSLAILDVGTGSGAIALALAHSLSNSPRSLFASDISPQALEVAQCNAERLKLSEKLRFVQSDLLGAFLPEHAGRFAIVASNPPYVADNDPEIEPQVRDFEPATALFAGPSGNAIYERLIPQAREALALGGWLVLEIGAQNEPAVRKLLCDWQEVEVRPDLRGIPRVVLARKSS